MSLAARGTLGGVLTFSERASCHQVRYQRKQKDYTNPARTSQRDYFLEATSWWNSLTDAEKEIWAQEGNDL